MKSPKHRSRAELVVHAFLRGESMASLAIFYRCSEWRIEEHIRSAFTWPRRKRGLPV